VFASFYFLKYTHPPTRETKVKHISSSSCYKNQRTKRKTTSRSVKRRLKKVCDIFLLLLRAFEETTPFDRSIDRSRVFDHTTRYERVCFSTRFSPRRYKNRFPLLRARSFLRCVFFIPRHSHRLAALGCLFTHMYTTGDQCQRPATEGSKYCAQHTGGK